MLSPYTIILAPNPSIMTGPGTKTIILGAANTGATIIDPGDDQPAHLDAIVRAGHERGEIKRILITHGHADHTGGAATLRERLGIPIYAFNRQGVSIADVEVPDGMTFPVGDDTLRAVHTPGHRFDHLCYLLERQRILFAGDIIAGVGTVVITPPEGDMLDYLNSLKRLQTMDIAEMVPAHGPHVTDPQAKLAEYIQHRLQREQQILMAMQGMPDAKHGITITDLVQHIYADVDPRLHPVAGRSVEAHLLKLEREDRVKRVDQDHWALTRG